MNRCTWRICRLFVCGLLGCCLAVSGAAVAAEEKAPAAKPAAPSEEELMAAMMKLATPGPQHAALKPLAGSWKAVVKTWMSPGDPVVTEGTAEDTLVLGGRFLKEEYHGTFAGEPFEGIGLTGYDNMKKKYVSAWVDSMGTMIQTQTGTMDASGKTLTFNGTWEDPVTHKKSSTRMVTRFVDDNTHTFEMYSQVEGKDHKEMEITYTRR